MGFFSKLWKGVKNVFTGILKKFDFILKPLGKLLDSSFGKALMIGLSIFTLGSAMIAGVGNFTTAMSAGKGFISSFVEGGQAFLQTLTGVGGAEQAPLGPTKELAKKTGEGIMQSGDTLGALQGGTAGLVEGAASTGGSALDAASKLTQGTLNAAGETVRPGLLNQATALGDTSKAMAKGGALGPTNAFAETGKALAQTATQDKGNWLSKAAKAAGDFITSDAGARVAGSLIEGVGNYYTSKDRQEFDDRIRREWSQGDRNANIRDIRAQGQRVGEIGAPSASGIASAARATANQNAGRPYFERQYGAAAPQPTGG